MGGTWSNTLQKTNIKDMPLPPKQFMEGEMEFKKVIVRYKDEEPEPITIQATVRYDEPEPLTIETTVKEVEPTGTQKANILRNCEKVTLFAGSAITERGRF
jgi:hypothetical protein